MEKYIKQCLVSILSQSLKEIELVCVDDGSKDSSAKILKAYAKNDERIKIISQKNQGVGIARNNGIRSAYGKYIAFMDPDDYYLDEKVLADMYEAAEENQVLICGGSLCEEHNNGKWFRKKFRGSFSNYVFHKAQYVAYEQYQYDYGFYRFIYNREFLIENNIFFPPYIRFQDPPFFVRAMICAGGFYALPRITYCYRCGHQNFKWDEKRICAVLSGFIDILDMSREAGLPELHRLTLERMLFEFRDEIIMGLDDSESEVLHLLLKANKCIKTEYVADDSDYKNGVMPLIAEWKRKTSKHKKNRNNKLDDSRNSRRSIGRRIYKRIKSTPRKIRRYIRNKSDPKQF